MQRRLAASGADVAYCGWQNVGEGVASRRTLRAARLRGRGPGGALPSQLPVAHPCRAGAAQRGRPLGGFSERRFSSMDYDFWLRVAGRHAPHRARARGAGLLPLARRAARSRRSSGARCWMRSAAQRTSSAPTPALVAHLPRDDVAGTDRRPGAATGLPRVLEARPGLGAEALPPCGGTGSFGAQATCATWPRPLLPLPLYRGLTRHRRPGSRHESRRTRPRADVPPRRRRPQRVGGPLLRSRPRTSPRRCRRCSARATGRSRSTRWSLGWRAGRRCRRAPSCSPSTTASAACATTRCRCWNAWAGRSRCSWSAT